MATLQSILAEYSFKRGRAEFAAKQAREKLFASDVELKELDDKKTALLMDNMKAALYGKARDIRGEVAALSREIDEKAVEAGLTAADLQPKYECFVCKDTGYVERKGKKEFCSCLIDRIYEEIYHAQPIETLKGSFETFDLARFSGEAKSKMDKNRRFAMAYLEQYPDTPRRDVVLLGSAGLGKTFLLECMAKELKKKQGGVLYLSALELTDLFYQHRLGQMSLLQPLLDAAVLLIDDLGTEPMTQNVTVEYYFRLFDYRLRNGLPTWVATNLSVNQIQSRYGERTGSRLFDNRNTAVLFFSGEDLRLKRK